MARPSYRRGSLILGGVATALTLAAALLFGNLIGYGADVRRSVDAMPTVATDVAHGASAAHAENAAHAGNTAGGPASLDAGTAGGAPVNLADNTLVGPVNASAAEYAPPWAVNKDYCCDLIVPNSDIVYPVVKGVDNTKYLTRTFTGEKSEIGSIFMDYRCTPGETPHTIIYGHDAQDLDGNVIMFGTLRNYLDQEFIDSHMEINLVCNGEVKQFTLFAVKVTDFTDKAYDLDFSTYGGFDGFAKAMGAPEGTREILTLSTCLGEGNDRLLVQGALL